MGGRRVVEVVEKGARRRSGVVRRHTALLNMLQPSSDKQAA